MIYINELSNYIETTLNSLEKGVFRVKTYAEFLDSRVDDETNENFIPVYIDSPFGNFEPIPNLLYLSQQYSITLYFPIELKDTMYDIVNDIVPQFVGKSIYIGENTGNAIANIDTPTFQSIGVNNVEELQEWCNDIYKRKIRKSSMYVAMSFIIHLTQATNGIFSNSITYTLTINGITESILRNESSLVQNNNLYSQQLENGLATTSNVDTTSNGVSFTAFVENNEFWQNFINLRNSNELSQATITLTKSYNGSISNVADKTYNVCIVSAVENERFGMPLSFTLSFGEVE